MQKRTVLKFLVGLFAAGVVFAVFTAVFDFSSPGDTSNRRPSVVTTVTVQPSSTDTASDDGESSAPAEPTTNQPTPSATGSSGPADVEGLVLAKFNNGTEGPYLVLAPADADRPSIKYLLENSDLRDLANVPDYLPYWDQLQKVSVPQDVYNNCKQYQTYSSASCADATSSSTTR